MRAAHDYRGIYAEICFAEENAHSATNSGEIEFSGCHRPRPSFRQHILCHYLLAAAAYVATVAVSAPMQRVAAAFHCLPPPKRYGG